MPRSGYSALHGVNLIFFYKKKLTRSSAFKFVRFWIFKDVHMILKFRGELSHLSLHVSFSCMLHVEFNI